VRRCEEIQREEFAKCEFSPGKPRKTRGAKCKPFG
jgi:hypothetical protein